MKKKSIWMELGVSWPRDNKPRLKDSEQGGCVYLGPDQDKTLKLPCEQPPIVQCSRHCPMGVGGPASPHLGKLFHFLSL